MFIRTELVGRESELEALDAILAEAIGGESRVVLCEGQPGIGKTRLASEVLRRAAWAGARTASGSGIDAAGAPPYWPWRQILRGVTTTDVLDERATRPTVEDRFRQFDAVAAALRETCTRAPLAVVFDDAHWADVPSLLLLQHVVRGLSNERLLLLVNCRDTEPQHRGLISDLAREPITRRLELRGLSAPAVRRQLALLTGHEPDTAVVDQVFAATHGNPFFVTEVGRLLSTGTPVLGAPLVTPDIRDAIAARVRRLPGGCAALLHAGAVLGAEFSVRRAAAVAQVPVEEALALLDEAGTAGLVEGEAMSAERRFVHALVRDAIEHTLGAGEQVRLHRAAAEAIEQEYPAPRGSALFELARHWAAAAVVGDQAHAVGWIERAAAEALHQRAFEDAADLYGQALEVGGAALGDEERCRLLLGAATAAHLGADFGTALQSCLQAAELARHLGRPDLLAEAALVMDPGTQAGVTVVIRRLCREAAACPGDAATRARLLARFAETFIFAASADEAGPASEEALRLADQSSDIGAIGAALRARHVIVASPEGLDERRHLAGRLLTASRSARDPAMELWARLWQIDASLEGGDLPRVAAEVDALGRCVEQASGPVSRFQYVACQAVLAQAQARFADALRLEREAFAVLRPTRHEHPFHLRAALASAVGRHIGPDEDSLAAAGFVGAADPVLARSGLVSAVSRAHAYVTAGRTGEAAEMYHALGPVAGWRPPPHVVLLTYAFGIAVSTVLSQPGDVATLRDRLAPYRGHHAVSGTMAVVYFGPVELWLGIAARHLAALDEAVADLEQAERACVTNGAAGFAVEAQYELAAALVGRSARGDVERARSLLARAAATAARLGMEPFVRRIDELAQKAQDTDVAPLTRREREVAELVAEGLSNREIASRLFTSARTAENHVQHILQKLGLTNRRQVGPWMPDRK